MQIKDPKSETGTLVRQSVIFMKTTPMCQTWDSSAIPKQGGSSVHAAQKLGYTVLNMASHRLVQEERSVKEILLTHNSLKGGEGNETLHYF